MARGRHGILIVTAAVILTIIFTLNDSIVVKDDHSPFLDAGFPSICLIDFDFGSAPGLNDWWHTPNDTIDKISAESLLVSGRLTAEILNALQQ